MGRSVGGIFTQNAPLEDLRFVFGNGLKVLILPGASYRISVKNGNFVSQLCQSIANFISQSRQNIANFICQQKKKVANFVSQPRQKIMNDYAGMADFLITTWQVATANFHLYSDI